MTVLHAVATWWDGVELWLTQLDFAVQVVLVVAVIGPLAWGASAVIDIVVERSVAARLAAGERRSAAAEPSSLPDGDEDREQVAARSPQR